MEVLAQAPEPERLRSDGPAVPATWLRWSGSAQTSLGGDLVVDVPMEKIAALTSASAAGDVERVVELLAEGVPVDAQNEQRYTALNTALMANVTSLLAAGRGTTSPEPSGATDQVAADRVGVVRVLLRAGADPEQPVGEYHENYPLARAALWGMQDMVAVLLEGGARPDRREERIASPVGQAAHQGHTEIVEMLLDQGVNIDGDSPQSSPLTGAAWHGRLQTVRYLLQRGARPHSVAVTKAEQGLAFAISRPDNDYAATPERLAEFTQMISMLKEALAGTSEADE
ncbi:MAG TPA: ankyrin repeat domain-containing protein [Kineosporiaceae bacterium]|nr:ankyrin repeat domain-containing protein [Kineosporiaceae bacterium]